MRGGGFSVSARISRWSNTRGRSDCLASARPAMPLAWYRSLHDKTVVTVASTSSNDAFVRGSLRTGRGRIAAGRALALSSVTEVRVAQHARFTTAGVDSVPEFEAMASARRAIE